MRKSHARTRARLWGAGAASALTVVSGLVAAAPAYALTAATATLPQSGPASGFVNVTLSGMLTGVTSPFAYYTTGTTCGDTYTANAANITATATRVSDDEVRIAVPTTLSLNAGAARKYTICIYASSTAGSAGKAQTTYWVTPIGTLTPNTGPSGGGNVVTFTAPTGSAPFGATNYAIFSTAAAGCPGSYPSGSPITATMNRQTTSQATVTVPAEVVGNPPTAGTVTPPATGYTVCFYSANTGSDNLTAQSTNGGYTVSLSTATLNQTTGAPYTSPPGTPSLTVTSPTAFLTGVTAPAVLFQTTACPALFPSAQTLNTQYNLGRKLSNSKMAITLPQNVLTPAGTFNVCTYSSASTTTGKLLAVANYTPVSVPQVTDIQPAAGSPLGGNLVTISGTNLPTSPGSITATLGGKPLTEITPINANTFTAVTPASTQGRSTLVIETAAGRDMLANGYTFIDSISVTPTTAPNTATTVDLDVKGTGFSSLTFESSRTPLSGPAVYLVDGAYANGNAGGTRGNVNAVSECGEVMVVSDTELVCRVNLTQTLTAADTYKPASVFSQPGTDITVANNSYRLVSATGGFTKGDIGKAVTNLTAPGTTIPAGTTVVDVLDGNTIVMSKAATAAATGGSTYTVGPVAMSATASVNSALTGTFTQADVGKAVTAVAGGSASVSGTPVITSVNSLGTTATLTGGTIGTHGDLTGVTLTPPASVPNGVYNIVVVSDSSINASSPRVSVASSGSTFTVANY
ncbi:IPT/TIG domain-containing protein [Actinoplanes sp. NPDC049802]|uniref:IPT/TIG domain-containing protein n=1 Tax=Actinoplanes sp. NPDC049802 TaxID=3154742 RepID=UPI00340AA349